MDLSIIIISWNTKEFLKKCLDSIYKNQENLNLEIIVVDNNSKDETIEMIKQEFKDVKLISNNQNRGFSFANNQAIKIATGYYILLLNPDTEILNGSLTKSIEFFKNHDDCGAMGAKLLWPDKSIQPSVRHFPTFWPIFLMFIKAPKFFKKIKSIDNYLFVDFDYSKTQVVDQIMGAFMMIPKKVIDEIGLLDERFFIWFEEVDLCKRIKLSNRSVFYNPKVEVIHYGGKSFAQEKIVKKQFLFFKSAMSYFLKNGFFNK